MCNFKKKSYFTIVDALLGRESFKDAERPGNGDRILLSVSFTISSYLKQAAIKLRGRVP